MKYVFKLGVCVIVSVCVLVPSMIFAAPASIYFGSHAREIEEFERITLNVVVSASGEAINAVTGTISFPDGILRAIAVSKERTIMDLWTVEPTIQKNKIIFEGVKLNPGFVGQDGVIFRVTFEGRKAGIANITVSEGAVLANDGLGSNVLVSLGQTSIRVKEAPTIFDDKILAEGDKPKDTQVAVESDSGGERLVALPVITEYSQMIDAKEKIFIKGKGEPDALTKIIFKNVAVKSLGERFLELVQTKRKKLDEVLVQNNKAGEFEYTSPENLLAGVYNATPFYVDNDTNTQKPGFGVQLLVSDSKIVKVLVVVINVLGLLIPIVGLAVIIYFIPWYSWRKMRLIKKRLSLEEEKIEVTGHEIERKEKVLDKTVDNLIHEKREE